MQSASSGADGTAKKRPGLYRHNVRSRIADMWKRPPKRTGSSELTGNSFDLEMAAESHNMEGSASLTTPTRSRSASPSTNNEDSLRARSQSPIIVASSPPEPRSDDRVATKLSRSGSPSTAAIATPSVIRSPSEMSSKPRSPQTASLAPPPVTRKLPPSAELRKPPTASPPAKHASKAAVTTSEASSPRHTIPGRHAAAAAARQRSAKALDAMLSLQAEWSAAHTQAVVEGMESLIPNREAATRGIAAVKNPAESLHQALEVVRLLREPANSNSTAASDKLTTIAAGTAKRAQDAETDVRTAEADRSRLAEVVTGLQADKTCLRARVDELERGHLSAAVAYKTLEKRLHETTKALKARQDLEDRHARREKELEAEIAAAYETREAAIAEAGVATKSLEEAKVIMSQQKADLEATCTELRNITTDRKSRQVERPMQTAPMPSPVERDGPKLATTETSVRRALESAESEARAAITQLRSYVITTESTRPPTVLMSKYAALQEELKREKHRAESLEASLADEKRTVVQLNDEMEALRRRYVYPTLHAQSVGSQSEVYFVSMATQATATGESLQELTELRVALADSLNHLAATQRELDGSRAEVAQFQRRFEEGDFALPKATQEKDLLIRTLETDQEKLLTVIRMLKLQIEAKRPTLHKGTQIDADWYTRVTDTLPKPSFAVPSAESPTSKDTVVTEPNEVARSSQDRNRTGAAARTSRVTQQHTSTPKKSSAARTPPPAQQKGQAAESATPTAADQLDRVTRNLMVLERALDAADTPKALRQGIAAELQESQSEMVGLTPRKFVMH